jgi:tellurite resistance protein
MGRASSNVSVGESTSGADSAARADVAGSHGRPRITPNLFGISFGLTGLAQAWGGAARLYGGASAPSDALSLVAAGVWGATLVLYVGDVRHGKRIRTELADPTFSPFIALVGIVPMLLGVTLAEHAHTVGVLVFAVSMALTVGISALLIGQWVVTGVAFDRWHPGYFLPTAASGYLSALACSTLGYDELAMAMFGYGTLGWLAFGAVPVQRLLTPPMLSGPLVPTMAILAAPPVVAGNAWFEMNGGRVDAVALGLGGYAGLMLLVQLRLVPVFRAAPFGPAWWAFSFTYAAVVADATRWLSAERIPHAEAWAYALLTALSAALLALAGRTLVAVRRGDFLPATPPSASTGERST